MNKFIDFAKKNKFIFLGILLFLVVTIVLILILNRSNEEKTLTKKLEEVGRDYWNNYYYDEIGKNQDNRDEILEIFKKQGIKFTLIALNDQYDDTLIDKFYNKKKKIYCNEETTTVTIYPKEPYGKKNYTIEVNLDCGF